MSAAPEQSNNRYVLITGASTGVGRAAAVHLANLGFYVFAGVRHPFDPGAFENVTSQHGGTPGVIKPVKLDVTDAESIAAATSMVKETAGAGGLSGLINNAGIAVTGPVEFVSQEQWRQQFDVNFFGSVAVTQAMLPLLRSYADCAGRGASRLIMISSVAGRVAPPLSAPYCASKFAMEALSDSLRLELRGQGIQVCVIQPGAIDTPIWTKGADVPVDDPSRELYGHQINMADAIYKRAAANAIPAETVARVIGRCMTRRKPRTRYVVGNDARLSVLARKFLPERIFDLAMRRVFKMD